MAKRRSDADDAADPAAGDEGAGPGDLSPEEVKELLAAYEAEYARQDAMAKDAWRKGYVAGPRVVPPKLTPGGGEDPSP